MLRTISRRPSIRLRISYSPIPSFIISPIFRSSLSSTLSSTTYSIPLFPGDASRGVPSDAPRIPAPTETAADDAVEGNIVHTPTSHTPQYAPAKPTKKLSGASLTCRSCISLSLTVVALPCHSSDLPTVISRIHNNHRSYAKCTRLQRTHCDESRRSASDRAVITTHKTQVNHHTTKHKTTNPSRKQFPPLQATNEASMPTHGPWCPRDLRGSVQLSRNTSHQTKSLPSSKTSNQPRLLHNTQHPATTRRPNRRLPQTHQQRTHTSTHRQ